LNPSPSPRPDQTTCFITRIPFDILALICAEFYHWADAEQLLALALTCRHLSQALKQLQIELPQVSDDKLESGYGSDEWTSFY
jgi:hypothetical protein